MDKELSDSEETPQHQHIPPRHNTPRQQQPSGYGIHNTENVQENMYQPQRQQQTQAGIPVQQPYPVYPQQMYRQPQPLIPARPVIIKDPGLFYDGKQFMKFLLRFERIANAFGATDHDKAAQILQFIQTEELKCELEEMDGYDDYDWKKLRADMVKTWGELDNTIMYTTDDLIKLAKQQSKSGIATHREYKEYLGKFTTILKYLVKNEHVSKKDKAGGLFLSAFPIESQRNVKQILVSKDQLPKAKDGSNKAPKWEDLIAAAETEVHVDDSVYTNFSSFSESNRTMQKELDQKRGDGKQREQMLKETPNEKTVDQKFQDMQQELAALKNQLRGNQPANYNRQGPSDKQEFSRGTPRPTTPQYENQSCFYCSRDGHLTYRCPELAKDEDQGLVSRRGRDYFLPDGQQIPFVPSRPIRTVVAGASADPQMQEAIKNLAESRQQGNGNTPVMKTSVQTIHWSPPTLGVENFMRSHPVTRSEAQKGRREVRIQEPEREAMDIDHEEEVDRSSKETPKKAPEKVWSRERVPTILKRDSPEEVLLQDLENVKIPTTFAQLTTILPSYTEQIIAKLQGRLSGKNTSTTYIATEAAKVAAPMTTLPEEEGPSDPCYYSCALGYVTAQVGGEKVDFMVDSGSMVNVIPRSVAEDLELESVIVNIPMQGVGGARCDITGVVKNCPIQIGRFSGPAHLFISPKAQDCILGRPFLFDYNCTLEYHETGETLTFQGNKGRRISVPLARTGQGRGWDNRKDLSTNSVKLAPTSEPSNNEEHRMFKKKQNQHFL
ncbi:hypothetical protein PtA15_6A238 [Puccinia triticina]|uniref:CCHC-type domain-containing protein n=1 Tax=Puccinia triticina TaxID=208348 RepID=A0ABY7CP96_9BASI|nr:uncharacterized protein PtA15_6A238 [Puccinia triticina]WAQ85610.1 hypothetical protein PtA15_6A238 [Puccinia triticina]